MYHAHMAHLKPALQRTVIFCCAGHHNLCVCFGAQSSALEQWASKVHTTAVDIQASRDIVQGIDHYVKATPESIVKDSLYTTCKLKVCKARRTSITVQRIQKAHVHAI